ncbi:hypothetical protein GGI42DRAFT_346693 [Trichoderma sp. SZMC 28013]
MLSSNYSFRTVYDGLFTSGALPEEVHSPEDGLLLLTAILSDTLFLQRNLASITVSENSSSHRHAEMPLNPNPYSALSPDGEYHRQKLALLYALDRWQEHFGEPMSSNILAYYFFCRVCLFYPHLGRLAECAGYTPQIKRAMRLRTEDNIERRSYKDLPITEEALDAAWRVLDHVNVRTQKDKCSIWLPIVVFYSALTVWHSMVHSGAEATGRQYTSLKILSSFCRELDEMPWSCCREMSATLARIMQENKQQK